MPRSDGIGELVASVFEAGLPTAGRLAGEVGVSRAALYAWRSGTRNPTPQNLVRLADVVDRRGGELVELAEKLRETSSTRHIDSR